MVIAVNRDQIHPSLSLSLWLLSVAKLFEHRVRTKKRQQKGGGEKQERTTPCCFYSILTRTGMQIQQKKERKYVDSSLDCCFFKIFFVGSHIGVSVVTSNRVNCFFSCLFLSAFLFFIFYPSRHYSFVSRSSSSNCVNNRLLYLRITERQCQSVLYYSLLLLLLFLLFCFVLFRPSVLSFLLSNSFDFTFPYSH